MRARRFNSYTAYSLGCATVWATILLAAQRRGDDEARRALKLYCAAWWSGWTSATIARIGYPPPRQLDATGEKALRAGSVALIALGVGSVIRFLWAAGRRG